MIHWIAFLLFLACAIDVRTERMLLTFILGNLALAVYFWSLGGTLVAVFQALLSIGIALVLLFISEGTQ